MTDTPVGNADQARRGPGNHVQGLAGMPAMNRSKLLTQIHAIVDARLFSGRPWLPDREACDALRRTFVQMGLYEQDPGDTETSWKTALGKEHHLDLIMVFAGLWWEFEMASILEEHGLIDQSECESIYDQLEAGTDPEDVMLPVVRKAYFEYYNPSKYLN